ncbi:MAG: His-Xaa-Ser system radical SAM maturase HxsC [Firmicutes bacterium]|nr:His-Xaa-Ser system radical SAM maturase HxsC [Bacillota bacterium]
MKVINAVPFKIGRTIILKMSGDFLPVLKEHGAVALAADEQAPESEAFVLARFPVDEEEPIPGLYEIPEDFISGLNAGDIVKILPNGELQLIWESASRHNAVFVTDYCNSDCIMCPQTPETKPEHHYETAKSVLSLIDEKPSLSFGITGGEPLLLPEKLIELFDVCQKRFPDVSIQLLTNGRILADFDVVAKVLKNCPARTLFCIPLYADNDVEHDAITGASGSFSQSIRGIHNLIRFKRPVEIRVVMVKQNSKRLKDLAHFIFWNFPFAVHVAFMGMETSGVASRNLENVWIDPVDYAEELAQAVTFLHQRLINVSIFNIPLCSLPENIRSFARDSISGWKKTFVPECNDCTKSNECCGFFATSVKKPEHIKPL